jgi:hypothetical protein
MGKAPEGGWRTAPHRRTNGRPDRVQALAQGQNQGQSAAPRRVSTTNFPYWPQSGDQDAPIPPYFSVHEDKFPGLSQEEKDAILNPDEDETLDEDETEDGESKKRRKAQLKYVTAEAEAEDKRMEAESQRKLVGTQRRVEELAEFGTLHPTDDDDERWYGIWSLGEGTRGRAVLCQRHKLNHGRK